jgi:outer membrane receptor protein involved in Fe transport
VKRFFANLVIFCVFLTITSQTVIYSQQSSTSLSGKILDSDNAPLPGATVLIPGTRNGVNSNESGDYFFNQIPQGKIKIQASFVGFQTKIVDFEVQPGKNSLDIVLEFETIKLEAVSVTAQKREQQIIDVPIIMNVISSGFLLDNNITELDKFSYFVPGLQIRMQGVIRPSFVIRGLSSDEVSPAAQPRISVFYNNVPISRTSGAAIELFDMQQIDVLKGPQGTLFGRGATIGAVHYISQKPVNDFEGYISGGLGNFNQNEVSWAVNLPVIKDKLMLRVAGIHNSYEGYIKNTFGGRLNGKNTSAGRFSASYFPSAKDKIDLVINLQKDDNPGIGFMSMLYPNTNGSNDPYSYIASLEQGDKLKNQRDLFDATISIKHFFNAHNFFTSISSYRKISAYDHWDGDGTAAAALDMSENDKAGQFYQEFRYSYSLKNRLNGSVGLSYWTEKASQNYWFSTNEQHMAHLFLNTGFLVGPDGQPYPITNLPDDPRLGQLAGLPLGTDHQEENKSNAVNQALESFLDATYQLTDRLSITGGVRLINEWFDLKNSADMSGGDPAMLGFMTGNYPDILFRESEERNITESTTTLTYRGGLKYKFNENANIFAGYSKGRRPKVLQFTSTGEAQILAAETVNSFDAGFKTAIRQHIWFDLGLFYHDYLNFQTSAWVADPSTGEFNYIVKDGGKSSAYGAEMNFKYSVLKGLQIFGNYAFIHSRFAGKDINGSEQAFAGNRFRLTPDHSFAVGLNAKYYITEKTEIFVDPSFSYRTKIYFEDANTVGQEQDGYGILFFRGGIELTKIKLTLSLWGDNLLNQKYIISAGNAGSLFGDPTQIPGAPRMFGTRLYWRF